MNKHAGSRAGVRWPIWVSACACERHFHIERNARTHTGTAPICDGFYDDDIPTCGRWNVCACECVSDISIARIQFERRAL